MMPDTKLHTRSFPKAPSHQTQVADWKAFGSSRKMARCDEAGPSVCVRSLSVLDLGFRV